MTSETEDLQKTARTKALDMGDEAEVRYRQDLQAAHARLSVSLDTWLSVAQPCPLCGVTVVWHKDQQQHIAWHLRNLQ